MNVTRKSLIVAALAAVAVSLGGCPGGGVPGAGKLPGGGGGSVDPNTCGNYAASDAGRKLKAFFEATVQLDAAVKESEAYIRETCEIMGAELGIVEGDLEGDTKTVCQGVIDELEAHLQAGIKAEANLQVDYQPAVCTVDIDVAAQAAAKCEASASADVEVRCSGSCSGTCNGQCDGACATKGADGACAGQCEGSCQGSCSGGCDGHAEVEASAECQASAEVRANVSAECTEPEVNVSYDAAVVVDKAKLEAAQRAIEKALPRFLRAQARVAGPIMAAFKTWSRAATDLGKSASKLAGSFGDQALCITGQLAAAAKMVAGIKVSVEVQVEVSASASGSVGG